MMPTPAAQDLAAHLHRVFDLCAGADDDNLTIADLLAHNPEAPPEDAEENVRQQTPEQYAREEEEEAGVPILPVPDVRQRDHFSCGAAASCAVGLYRGVGPEKLEEWKKLLGTNAKTSTQPERIIAVFKELGCPVEARQNMTVEDLAEYTAEGWPVIVCVQDYGQRKDQDASYQYGHYLTVIGVSLAQEGSFIFCQDSSADNVSFDRHGRPSESIAAPGRIMVEEKNWLNLWHDQDSEGNKLVHFGIAIGPPAATRVTHEPRLYPKRYERADPMQYQWIRYVGPRGGKGYIDTVTGKKRYGGSPDGGVPAAVKPDGKLPLGQVQGPVGREALHYTDHSPVPEKSCATCRFFEDGQNLCHLFEDFNTIMPDKFDLDTHVSPQGVCQEWTEAPEEEEEP